MRERTPPPLPPLQLSRAAVIALAAAMTMGSGCKDEQEPISKDPKTKPTSSQTEPDKKPAQDASDVDDHGAIATKYGGPSTHPTPIPSPKPTPPSSAVPAYGAPPPSLPKPK